MSHYKNSIDALKELLLFPSKLSHRSCSITKIPHNVTNLSNGLDYCLVELTCDNGIKYGIQAYGDEAVELHKEALKQQQRSIENEEEQEIENGDKGQMETPIVYGISN